MCWGFFCVTSCFTPSTSLFLLTLTLPSLGSGSSLGLCSWVLLAVPPVVPPSLPDTGCRFVLLWLTPTLYQQHKSEAISLVHERMEHVVIWVSACPAGLFKGSAAPQGSAASVPIARSGDVSWQTRTKSKQKWIKPMSEALRGLWIRSRRRLWCGDISLGKKGRLPSPHYIIQTHGALWVYFYLHLFG